MYTSWYELIQTNFHLLSQNSKGWWSLRCPVCHDKKVRGGFLFNGDGFGYNCFRGSCGHRVRIDSQSDLNKSVENITTLMRAVNLNDTDWTHLLYENIDDYVAPEKTTEIIEPKTIKLPLGSTELLKSNPSSPVVTFAINYLIDRGVDPTIDKYFITTALPHKKELDFRNRLIIPFYYNGELIFYQGAWVHPTWKTSIKYLNTDLTEREAVFYNMDELNRDTDDPLFVVEGAFDARWFRNAVGTISNVLTEQQILRLNKSRRRIIIIPDNDKAGAKMVTAAIQQDWDVSFPGWYGTEKDLDDAIRRLGKVRAAQEIMNEIKTTQFEKELVIEFLKFSEII